MKYLGGFRRFGGFRSVVGWLWMDWVRGRGASVERGSRVGVWAGKNLSRDATTLLTRLCGKRMKYLIAFIFHVYRSFLTFLPVARAATLLRTHTALPLLLICRCIRRRLGHTCRCAAAAASPAHAAELAPAVPRAVPQ